MPYETTKKATYYKNTAHYKKIVVEKKIHKHQLTLKLLCCFVTNDILYNNSVCLFSAGFCAYIWVCVYLCCTYNSNSNCNISLYLFTCSYRFGLFRVAVFDWARDGNELHLHLQQFKLRRPYPKVLKKRLYLKHVHTNKQYQVKTRRVTR